MKIESAFFCDDVRKEDNGKLIFVGCYAGDINVSPAPTAELPIMLELKLVLCGDFNGVTELEVEVSLRDNRLLKGKLKTQDAPIGFSFLPIPLPNLIISKLGQLVIKLKLPTGKWKEMRSIEVKSDWPLQPLSSS